MLDPAAFQTEALQKSAVKLGTAVLGVEADKGTDGLGDLEVDRGQIWQENDVGFRCAELVQSGVDSEALCLGTLQQILFHRPGKPADAGSVAELAKGDNEKFFINKGLQADTILFKELQVV